MTWQVSLFWIKLRLGIVHYLDTVEVGTSIGSSGLSEPFCSEAFHKQCIWVFHLGRGAVRHFLAEWNSY